ncbi:MBL fold metallo-hydrolase [Oscillatoria sp. CS-180]|nr:MBL fold metallo-hydrolase [Oscillatoria sp. CS-180]
MSQEFIVQFWGVRGNVPTPGSDTMRYGGNTACVEVLVAGQRIIFDGGTGLRALGKSLLDADKPIQASIFFTHTHWDRIQGFPFFRPAFTANNCFDIYGSAAANGASIKQCLMSQMLRPHFFTPLQKMSSTLTFHNILAGDVVSLDEGVTVETITLNPQTSALGFRITYSGKSLVYATDTSNIDSEHNPNLLYLAKNADLLIYGGTYSEVAFQDSTERGRFFWEKSIDLAEKSQAKEMILFHHDPEHDDDYLDQVGTEIHNRCSRIHLAHEGMILQLASVDRDA